VLLYLYWEPRNADDFPDFSRHRAEVERFSRTVEGANPVFASMTYRDLWVHWAAAPLPAWLPDHLAAVRGRYDIAI